MGRYKLEGARHSYKVAEDVHQYIMKKGGGEWLTEVVRAIRVSSEKEQA